MDAETRQEIAELHRRCDALQQAVQSCATAIAILGGLEPAELAAIVATCPNPWHRAPLEARRGVCIDCGARLGANVGGLPGAPT